MSTRASHALLSAAATIAVLTFTPAAQAASHDHSGHGTSVAQSDTSTQAMLADGEIKRIDKAAGKVTVSHGPLKNLGMPPMTMVFRVKDSAWLDQMRINDKIRFQAENIDGSLTIVRFEKAK